MKSSPARRPWSRAELVAVFGLYCHTPFGRLHRRNPEVQRLAGQIGRSASAVAMKACNFAALDPALRGRVSGLANVSLGDRELWQEFLQSPERIAIEAETALSLISVSQESESQSEPLKFPVGPTEVERTVQTRRVQSFFRRAVLSSYNYRCALTGIAEPELLIASHIIPWGEETARRADPSNGICLNALHDRAFDRGFIAFDEDLRTLVSPTLRDVNLSDFGRRALRDLEGTSLTLPDRFQPDPSALRWHRENRFR